MLEIAKNSVASGLSQFNQSLTSTLDFLLPTEFLGKYDVVSKINDYYSEQADMYSDKLEESVSDRGKAVQIGAKTLETATSAAPNALLTVMSGGSSAAAQGSTAALTATSAAVGKTAAANAIQQAVKNPLYWSSVTQTLGNNYESAKANGADELQAIGSAFTSSLLNAAVETSGGMEALPGALKSGTGPATAWARSALAEGAEEPVQSAVSGLSQKLFFDEDKKLASLSDETAVFHPGRMGQEFAMGTAVGGLLGTGQLAGHRLAAADPMVRARQGDYSGLVQELDQIVWQKKLKELEAAYEKHVDTPSLQAQATKAADVDGVEFSGQEEYSAWLASIGAQGSELDTLEKYNIAKYNNSSEFMMLERYATDVEAGWISPLSGFANYQEISQQIKTDVVGKTTANGIVVNGYVPHFMHRVIGTAVDPKILKEELQVIRRSGVSVNDVKIAVFSPEKIGDVILRKSGQKSIRFIGENCVVTISPDTGELIQTNPLGG